MTALKKIMTIIAGSSLMAAAAVLPVHAETVSRREAAGMAQLFFNAVNGQIMAKPQYVYNGRNLTTDRLFAPFYVFNHPAGGFVIISAENKAYPILAYSRKDRFEEKDVKGALKALLTQYALDIERVRYDSTIPVNAIEAWNYFPQYLGRLLDSPYNATDPAMTIAEARETLDGILESDDWETMCSDIYTTSQWLDAVNSDLQAKGSLPLGLFDGERMVPVIVHGRRAEMYRVELDRRNDWMVRLNATEVLTPLQVADFANKKTAEPENTEPEPFQELDDILAMSRARWTGPQIEDLASTSSPVVTVNGGGHFTVTLPRPAVAMQLYAVDGRMVDMRSYPGNKSVVIDLDREAPGFYVANFITDNGQRFGVKLFK